MNRFITLSRRQDPSTAVYMLSVSADGYIRLSFARLQTITLVHLISGLDENIPKIAHCGAMPTEITGYTEWATNVAPTITIGWDWQMDADCNRILLRRISEPRSNILLQDAAGMDVGPEKTIIMLEAFIDGIDWSQEARNYIDICYMT